jgi:mercuric ion transport protein
MDGGTVKEALSHEPNRRGSAPPAGAAGLAAAGGVVAALASISCCILPLAFFTLGISGAWIANLTALEPYQPIFFAATGGFLCAGYYLVHRRSKIACADGSCARPLPPRLVKGALWMATVLVLAAILFRYLAPLLQPI